MSRFLSLVFALAPFGFSLIRARQSGDVRMLWMAVAGFGAALVMAAILKYRKGRTVVAATTFSLATAAAGMTRVLVGGVPATSPGLWLVAAVFGFCFAMSAALFWSS